MLTPNNATKAKSLFDQGKLSGTSVKKQTLNPQRKKSPGDQSVKFDTGTSEQKQRYMNQGQGQGGTKHLSIMLLNNREPEEKKTGF